MVLLDASAIARNVGGNLIFSANSHAAYSHSELGVYAYVDADALECTERVQGVG
jgi:hypothetical protein